MSGSFESRVLIFAGCALVLSASTAGAQEVDAPRESRERPKIAAICTKYQPLLHADVIVSKFILGFPTDDGIVPPEVKVASLYIEQRPPDCLGRQLAKRFEIPVYEKLEDALTLGGDSLAVDGVLLIGEHGDYPVNRLGQVMYPRMLWLKRIFRVFESSRRVVPVFCDKQLSYNWLDAKWMMDRARELKAPMMAGSVIPHHWRDPPDFDQPRGAKVSDAAVIYHGDLDRYAIHGLELLQSLLERRKGSETGVRRVECLQNKDFDRAVENGHLPMDLFDAALRKHLKFTRAEKPLINTNHDRIAIRVEYNDGTRGCVFMVGPHYMRRWLYASRTEGKVLTCEFGALAPDQPEGPTQPVAVFSYQGLNIQRMFVTGEPQYPIDRTLLTSGIAAVAMRSAFRKTPIDTPFLDVRYKPFDFEPIRPKGRYATGASIEPWPKQPELRPLFEWRGL